MSGSLTYKQLLMYTTVHAAYLCVDYPYDMRMYRGGLGPNPPPTEIMQTYII